MALGNAERQAAWRKRHADERRAIARIANLLMRRSKTERRAIEAKLGWNTVTFDRYFYTLAIALGDVLKTDRAIRQLRWALHQCLYDRQAARRHAK
jgi:hypothetical protein